MPDTYWDLFYGYGAYWLLLAGFVLKMGFDQSRLRREVAELSSLVESRSAAQSSR